MAQPTFQPPKGNRIKSLCTLYPVVSVGAAGAVTLQKRTFTAAGASKVAPSSALAAAPTTGVGYVVGDGAGTATVVRTGTGAWTITLSDSYQYLVSVMIAGIKNTAATNANAINSIAWNTTGDVTTNTSVGSGGTIQVILYSGSTATDPASGDTVILQIVLGDATEP
jgi:hypothetical protein